MASRRFLALLLFVTIGCGAPPGAAPKAAPANPAPPAITVVQPQKKAVRRVVEQPGSIQADEETTLFAKLPGYVRSVYVDIDSRVLGPIEVPGFFSFPGTVLAEIAIPEMEEEARQMAALIRKADAEAQQARKALAAAEAGIKTAVALVAVAKAGLTGAEAQYARWESEATRVTSLTKGGVLDAQTRDETQNQFRTAAAAREEARARVTVAEEGVIKAQADRDKVEADVTAALAKIEVARAEEARVRALLAYTVIRAPYPGVVTRRHVNTGDFLRPEGAKEGIFTVARLDPVRAVVAVPEADAGLVRDGSPAKLTVQGSELSGRVTRTSWALEPGSRTLRAEVDLPNKDGRLRPGMYVHARISAELPEAWAVPAGAVIKYGDGLVCYLVENGKAVRVAVQVRRGDGQVTQVARWQKPGSTEWLDFTGQEHVVAPAANVTDGQALP